MDYAARTAHFVDTYVAESEKAQILQATKLERVKQELETKEDYTLFITAFDEKKGFVYKRVMYSYYDANKKMITISRLDISSLVERYEAQIKKLRKENDLDALTAEPTTAIIMKPTSRILRFMPALPSSTWMISNSAMMLTGTLPVMRCWSGSPAAQKHSLMSAMH